MGDFDQVFQQWAGVEQEQNELRRAVAAGQLRMVPGVAQTAAQRCEQAIHEIDMWLSRAERLVERLPFGANQDGEAAADDYAAARRDFIKVMTDAQQVFRKMADTYLAAGRTMNVADEVGRQMFQGHPG